MFRLALTISAIALTGAAAPQAPEAKRVDITLSSFKYAPATIRLVHGQPYVLHFVNSANGGHDFAAPAFFAAANVAAGDRGTVKGGRIELDGGASADVHLVAPAAGTYDVKCTHFMHSMFGMKASIVVS